MLGVKTTADMGGACRGMAKYQEEVVIMRGRGLQGRYPYHGPSVPSLQYGPFNTCGTQKETMLLKTHHCN